MSKVGVAIVGLGPASLPHGKSLVDLSDQADVIWAATRSPQRAEAFVKTFPFPTTTDDSVRTMQLIDATYEAAGLPPRGMSATASSAETGSFTSRGLRL